MVKLAVHLPKLTEKTFYTVSLNVIYSQFDRIGLSFKSMTVLVEVLHFSSSFMFFIKLLFPHEVVVEVVTLK